MQVDATYQRALKFLKKFQNTNQTTSVSNLYVAQTIDRDGNITSEHYGFNLMTNNGMTKFFTQTNDFPQNLYIGNGSGSIRITDTALNSPITTNAATIQNSSVSYDYPLYYDSITGIVTTVMRYRIVYFDYNISGIDGPVEISEYGIGGSWTDLWTHSWVYNSIGQRSTITKNVNERLVITVYFCMSYSTSLIIDGFDNGRYICITNQGRFFRTSDYVRMVEANVYTFKRDSFYARSKSHTISAFVDNKYEISTNVGSFILSEEANSSNSYIDGFVSWDGGFNLFDRVKLSNPESFENVIGLAHPTYFDTITGFSNSFGIDGYGIPFTQADITNSYTFNRTTGQYDCPDTFINDPDKWYNEIFFNTSFKMKMTYTNNNEFQTVYLYRNMNTDDPIVAIKGSTTTLYATDQYWDTSSWVRISDMNNVPQNVRNAKFWLSGHSDIAISPVRGKQSFEFLDSNQSHGYSLQFNQQDIPQGFSQTSSDDIYHQWFTIGGNVYIITRGNAVVKPSDTNSAIGYNKNILSYGDNGNFVLTNITRTVIDPAGEVIPNIASIGSLRNCAISESHTGYAIFKQEGNNSYCVKVDMTGENGITQTQLQNTIYATCIYNNATYYAVIESADSRKIVIRKLSDDSTYKYFSIPTNKNVPLRLYGFGKYVYATDCSTYGYVFDITGSNDSALETDGFIKNSYITFKGLRVVAVDDLAIVYSYDSPGVISSNYAVIMEASNPTVVKNFSIDHGGAYYSGLKLNLFKINGNTFILEKESQYSSGRYCISHYAFDLGHYLYDGTIHRIERGNTYEYNIIQFGEFAITNNTVFPAANMIPHRLKGSTSCVSTHFRRKHISNKSFAIEVTNIADYDGKPPGNSQ